MYLHLTYYVHNSSKHTFGKRDDEVKEVMEEVQIDEKRSLTDFITHMYNSFTGLHWLQMLGLNREMLMVVESFQFLKSLFLSAFLFLSYSRVISYLL